jgi:hypothetical protein
MIGWARVGVMLGVLIAIQSVAGCSSHPPKVDCDKHLQPINAPAPNATGDGARKPTTAAPSSDSSNE